MNNSATEKIHFKIDSDNNIIISANRYAPVVYSDKNDRGKIIATFKELSKSSIKSVVKDKNDSATIIFQKPNERISATFANYRKFKEKDYFSFIKEKIQNYNIRLLANRIRRKLNTKTLSVILAGSLVAASSSIILHNVDANGETIITSAHNNLKNNVEVNPDTIIITPENIPETQYENIGANVSEIESSSRPLDPYLDLGTDLETNEDLKGIYNIDEIDTPETSDIEQVQNDTIINDGKVDFNELKNLQSYDDYIKFAAKMYFLDYNTLKGIVDKYFANPGIDVLNLDISEINYMEVLKEKGFIEGDLNKMLIFIIARKYAYNYTELDSLPPIKSNKTSKEIEQDIINVAKNIYGINDNDLLKLCLAIHKLETGHYTSELAIENNNMAGNVSNGVFNSYRTAEIGVEGAIRGIMNNIYSAINRNDYNPNSPIQFYMSKSYCTHTPDEWATEVTNILSEEYTQELLDNYLGKTSKTY